jgi:hypothetical protein
MAAARQKVQASSQSRALQKHLVMRRRGKKQREHACQNAPLLVPIWRAAQVNAAVETVHDIGVGSWRAAAAAAAAMGGRRFFHFFVPSRETWEKVSLFRLQMAAAPLLPRVALCVSVRPRVTLPPHKLVSLPLSVAFFERVVGRHPSQTANKESKAVREAAA